MTVFITFTTVGTDAGPFNLYSDVDGYSSAFEVGVTPAQLLSGFPSNVVPLGTTIIRAKSFGLCTNFLDMPLLPAVSTSTTSSTSTTTTSTTDATSTTTTTTTTTLLDCNLTGTGVIQYPAPTCPDQILVFQICNSNSARDDNFDIILNGTSIGIIDLNADAQVGGLFIGSLNPALTVTEPDFVCPLGLMVVNRFDPNLLHYGLNTIKMQNVQNNGNGNFGNVGLRSYTLSGNDLITPCVVANMTYNGLSGESFDLSFTYTECCEP